MNECNQLRRGHGRRRRAGKKACGGGVDDDALLNAALAAAHEMHEQLLKELEHRWQIARDRCVSAGQHAEQFSLLSPLPLSPPPLPPPLPPRPLPTTTTTTTLSSPLPAHPSPALGSSPIHALCARAMLCGVRR